MRLVVAAVGRLKKGPERDLAERYLERAARLSRLVGLRGPDIIEIDDSRARRPEDRAAEESAALAAAVTGTDTVLIALDAAGEPLSSAAVAERLAKWRDEGRSACALLIGGPD